MLSLFGTSKGSLRPRNVSRSSASASRTHIISQANCTLARAAHAIGHLPIHQMQRKLKSLYKRDLEDLVTRCGAPAWKRTKDDLARIIVDFLLSFNGGGGYYPTMLNRQDQGPLFINSNWDAEAASQHL
uniref:Uncharacterized protein n=1 Tax=Rhodosorus marinus TaxID=101924 RepID=A0A7S2ZKZ3_9RHOD